MLGSGGNPHAFSGLGGQHIPCSAPNTDAANGCAQALTVRCEAMMESVDDLAMSKPTLKTLGGKRDLNSRLERDWGLVSSS